MTPKQKRTRARIVTAAALFAAVWTAERLLPFLPVAARLTLYAVPYLLIGYDVLKKAWINLSHGQAFDECFLMTVATIAAFAIGEYPEAAAVMLFYQVGELFQSVAVGRSRASISELMRLAPEYAELETEQGVTRVPPEEVSVGGVIVVKAGERVPLDGVVLSGASYLDTSALTGEAAPRRVAAGDTVYSGCINGAGALRVRTTKAYEESTVARILELVENAGEKKARMEQFITRFARIYTPAVTVSAALLALVPPLLGQPFGEWVHRACVFLIVSCPCALVISVPLGFFGGIGAASRVGVLVKGGSFLETLAGCETMVFDKTGTLTKGEFRVTKLLPAEGIGADELLCSAAHAEAASNHPIASAVLAACAEPPDLSRVTDASEISGYGVRVLWDGKELLAGSGRLLERYRVAYQPRAEAGTLVYVACNGRFLGCIVISDTLKEGAAEAVHALRNLGVRNMVLLTGDREAAAREIAEQLGIGEVQAELLPTDKVARLEAVLERERGGRVAFVGDGINDAPALMRADVGIAMGALGSDAAIEAADIVLMDDDIRKLASAMRIGKDTVRIVRENVAFALFVKFAVLVLGAFGRATMWFAVFGDVGVTVLAVLNAMRCLRLGKK